MYPAYGNVIYCTINSADIRNLLDIGISHDRIFLLPDPIDVDQYTDKPLWEMDIHELGALGLEPADYREILLRRLADCAHAKKQFFNGSLDFLFSPVKMMRRKNNAESLLLMQLFNHLGRDYQLLISLDANSPPDIAYSKRIKRFARARDLPVLVGFGRDMISGTTHRTIRAGRVLRFNMCDMHALCASIITTSIVEGFGLTYHEGWLSRRPVIGRKIPETMSDFEDNGMDFTHMYEKLAVPTADVPDIRERLHKAYERKIQRLMRWPSMTEQLTALSVQDIIESKLFGINGERCIDFADLSLDMQLDVLDKLTHESSVANGIIERNPSVLNLFRLIRDGARDLVERNRAIVTTRYSLQAMAQRLETLFEVGDSLYRSSHKPVSPTEASHAAVTGRYCSAENLRLLF
jgi:hypothetical protein